MKRKRIDLEQIADYSNLSLALYKAAKGKRHRDQVKRFMINVNQNINQLASDILQEGMPYGRFRSFYINDPKKRLIHAACFEDRIFHHAVINLAGNTLEKAMLPTSFACRPNLGVHRAAEQTQKNIQRYRWYCQIDIASYFAKIDHELLYSVLCRRFKGNDFKQQLKRLIGCYPIEIGKGLPIGSLTSQYFANYYLDGLDRLLNTSAKVRAHVRYMDDIVWWCDDKQAAKQLLAQVQGYLRDKRKLDVKPTIRIQKSEQGISFCGFHIFKSTIRLSARRKQRYQKRRLYWEHQYRQGKINAQQLQMAYAAVHAITQGTDSQSWRQKNLCLHPPITA